MTSQLQAPAPSCANTSTYRFLIFFFCDAWLLGRLGGGAPGLSLVPVGVGGAESSPGGAKLDLTRIAGLFGGGDALKSTAPALADLIPALFPFAVPFVPGIFGPIIAGEAVCARGGGGGGGASLGASPPA